MAGFNENKPKLISNDIEIITFHSLIIHPKLLKKDLNMFHIRLSSFNFYENVSVLKSPLQKIYLIF